MKNIEAKFSTGIGGTFGAYTPDIGARPINVSGGDHAVVTAQNRLRGGNLSGADSVYKFNEAFRGNLMDATFTITCLSDFPQDIRVYLLYNSADTNGFYAGLRWGSQAQWALFSGSGGVGGVQLANINPVPGKSYNLRLRVNPYQTSLYVDGVLLFTSSGGDWVGDPNIRSAALSITNIVGLTDGDGWQISNLRIWSGNPRPTSTTIPAGLLATYQQELMCLSTLVRIVRTDGVTLGFTTHDRSLTVGGLKYEAMSAVTASNIRLQSGKDPDNMDISGILNSDSITEDDLRSGKYDDAKITVMECDWSNLSGGVRVNIQGVIGDLAISDGIYKATILSNLQILQRQVGETTGPSCHVHMLGDARCKVNLAGNTATGKPITSLVSVATVTAQNDLILSGNVTDAGFYTYGLLTSTSGRNNGLARQIKLHGTKNAPDTPTCLASPLSTGNLSYKNSVTYTPSQTVNVPIPAGVWDSAELTITSVWSNIGLMNDPDILKIQIPPGQNNESDVRATNAAATYTDYFGFGVDQLAALNAAAGSNLAIAYRHTSNIPTGAPFMHVSIASMSIALIGTANGVSSRIVLQEEFPYPISAGDTFSAQAGCDRVHTTCIKKYANIDNFRGFPAIPGNNLLQQQGRGANGK